MSETTVDTAWRMNGYPSGSIVVTRGTGALYRIMHPRLESDDRGRYEVAQALAKWLNGEPRAPALDVLFRDAPHSVMLQNGHHIIATGPMISSRDGGWHQDDGADAKVERWELIEALIKDERP